MLHNIDYKYFIFPLLSLFYFFLEKKIKFIKNNTYILGIFLVIFLGFSEIGSDYDAYKGIYNTISSGADLNLIHGEAGYKRLNLLFYDLGFSFELFKTVYLGLLISLLYIYIIKMSSSVSFSLFLLYCFYIIYLCSAFRQLASITACFVGFYYVKQQKNFIAIIINFMTLFIHSSSILPLLYFIFLKLRKIKLIKKTEKLFLVLFVSLIFRVVIGIYVQKLSFIFRVIGKEGQFLFYSNGITLMSIGMLARIFVLVIMIFNLKIFLKNQFMYKIFMYYYLGIIIYMLLPIELFAGRLTNNAKVVEVLLIPYLINSQYKFLNKVFLIFVFIILGFVIFINQLLKQGGYYPYQNLYF